MEKIKRSILLEVNHPGQVHLFRNVYHSLISKRNNVIVITKRTTAIEDLLKLYNIPYFNIGEKKKQINAKVIYQILYDYNAFRIARNNNIQLAIGSSITNDHISRILNIKSLHFSDDDENVVPFISNFSYPFCDLILSPDCVKYNKHTSKVIGYAGYHELAYLHPRHFIPDFNILSEVGIDNSSNFFLMRFNAFEAHHDKRAFGLNLNQKLCLIEELKPFGKIFITTEKHIEPELKRYELKIRPDKIHSLLSYATVFIGDSQTMASEAAVLGIPSFRCNSYSGRLSTLEEQEKKYGLTFSYQPSDFDKMLAKIHELLALRDLKYRWQTKKEYMLKDKIDVTAFFVWFIENYPDSKKIMKENPDYQYRFR